MCFFVCLFYHLFITNDISYNTVHKHDTEASIFLNVIWFPLISFLLWFITELILVFSYNHPAFQCNCKYPKNNYFKQDCCQDYRNTEVKSPNSPVASHPKTFLIIQ